MNRLSQEELEAGAKQADEWWDEFSRKFNTNICPWCDGHGRVGIFACNACGATGQRPAVATQERAGEKP